MVRFAANKAEAARQYLERGGGSICQREVDRAVPSFGTHFDNVASSSDWVTKAINLL